MDQLKMNELDGSFQNFCIHVTDIMISPYIQSPCFMAYPWKIPRLNLKHMGSLVTIFPTDENPFPC
jgi:hypothetical protein